MYIHIHIIECTMCHSTLRHHCLMQHYRREKQEKKRSVIMSTLYVRVIISIRIWLRDGNH